MGISKRLKPHLPYFIFILSSLLIAVCFTYLLIPAVPPSLSQIRQHISDSDDTRSDLKLLKEYLNNHPRNPEAASLFYYYQADYFAGYLPDEWDDEFEEEEPDSLTKVLEKIALADYWQARKEHAARMKELRSGSNNQENLLHAALFDFNQVIRSFYGPSKYDTYEDKTIELDELLSYPAVNETPYLNIMEAMLIHYREDAPLRLLLSEMEDFDYYDWDEKKESLDQNTDLSKSQKQQLMHLLEERNKLLVKYEGDALREIEMKGNLEAAYFTLLEIYNGWSHVFPGKLKQLIFSKEFIQFHNPGSHNLSSYYEFSPTESLLFLLKFILVKSYFYLFIAFLGTLIWAVFFYLSDLFEREKIIYTIIAFGFGILSAIGVIFLNMNGYGTGFTQSDTEPVMFLNQLSYNLTNAGLPEEGAKFLFFIIFYFLFRKQVNESFDFILYPAFVALGFAFLENLLYFDHSSHELTELIFIRSLGSISHCVFTMFAGIAFYTMLQHTGFSRKILILLGGYLIASFVHGLFNTVVSYDYLIYLYPGVELLILQAGIFYMLRQSKFYGVKQYNAEKNFRYYKITLIIFSTLLLFYGLYSSWIQIKLNHHLMWLVFPFLIYFSFAYYIPNTLSLGDIFRRKHNDTP